MSISRDHDVFEGIIRNYWEYYRELEEEFLLTRRYVDFDEKNNKTFSVEFLKLFQAVCSEIDVVGKAMAQIVEPSFKPEKEISNINKWWFFIQNDYKLAEGPFTPMNPSKDPALFSLQEYKCNLLGHYVVQPWEGYITEQQTNTKGFIYYRPVPGNAVPGWWSAYTAVKHHRVTLGSVDKNYEKANLGNVIAAFAALYVLEKALLDTVGTIDDLSAFLNFSSLFVVRRRYTENEMNILTGCTSGDEAED